MLERLISGGWCWAGLRVEKKIERKNKNRTVEKEIELSGTVGVLPVRDRRGLSLVVGE